VRDVCAGGASFAVSFFGHSRCEDITEERNGRVIKRGWPTFAVLVLAKGGTLLVCDLVYAEKSETLGGPRRSAFHHLHLLST
jgi:hypothetical protein